MKHHSKWLLVMTFLMLWTVSGAVSAAPGDYDNDGVPDATDACGKVAGPVSNNGCPLPHSNSSQNTPQEQPLHPPGDSDGDGTLDENDKCLLDGGPSWNNGCPTDQTAPSQPTTQIVLPTMPTSGPCVIATAGQDRVNLRAMPAATSAIIGVLNPASLYPAFATFTNEGGVWYLVKTGWSAGSVLRTGGLCDTLPSFDFGDVLLNFSDGPGDGVILNFTPVPGGKPFVTLHPFGQVALNFTKTGDDFPDAGFAFLLTPFPGAGSSDNPPADTPVSPASDIFDDGFLRSHMGDGSVFVMMPPGNPGGSRGIIAILIGLLRSQTDLNGILIGLNQPSFDPTKILIGLNQPAAVNGDGVNTYGILIGMLLPAVQTGDANTYGILIGLLQPALQDSQDQQFGFSSEPFLEGGSSETHPDGANDEAAPVSVQKVHEMGLGFFVPSAGAPANNLFTAGWGVTIEGAGIPTG
jgi:hypothetical protein